ncbi:methyltransferase [Geothermobacter hydrogeniphilus]|uniref:Methyltransferase n=1 Tax=Geothermobacter hydrogeniphilus TaxID=1969733 RepID=A0A2K2H5D6_9BACT|nr:methyltransferase [Geothermobacter hydrogeniphilus]PNU18542.1 methyltransferase [Geothermobacter hydrogeniphilus]
MKSIVASILRAEESQSPEGYRWSLDPFLLVAFAGNTCKAPMMDLGCGRGIIQLLLAAGGAEQVDGIERQPLPVAAARKNLGRLPEPGRFRVVHGDLRLCRELFAAQSYRTVLANPPYRSPKSGRIAPDPERAGARHEMAGGLEDFIRAAAYLLKNNGHFCIVYLPERLAELLSLMQSCKIEPKRLRMVHSREGEGAKLVLVEGRRAARPGGLKVEAPLYVYDGDDYSAEVREIYAAFGLGQE